VQAERGFVILAANTDTVDYVGCAVKLAGSIKNWCTTPVAIVTNDPVPEGVFDYVCAWPFELDANGYANDWQCFHASPFRQTVKLEADMLMVSSPGHWWDMLQHRDLVVSTGARDHQDQLARSRYYRAVFDSNHLPDVYNAITYWRLSHTAQEFFSIVRAIFADWAQFKTLLKFPEETPSTDVVYAMAAQIVGPDLVTQPWAEYPRLIHMRQHIVGSQTADWTQEFVWEWDGRHLRINTLAQHGAVHYNIKTWNPDERNYQKLFPSS
jgi:hypothetical protein